MNKNRKFAVLYEDVGQNYTRKYYDSFFLIHVVKNIGNGLKGFVRFFLLQLMFLFVKTFVYSVLAVVFILINPNAL